MKYIFYLIVGSPLLVMAWIFRKNSIIQSSKQIIEDTSKITLSDAEILEIKNLLTYYLTHNPNGHINDICIELKRFKTWEDFAIVYNVFGDVYLLKLFGGYLITSVSVWGYRTNMTNAFNKVLNSENKKKFNNIIESLS